ncbi:MULTISPECIES: hypothetical protein [Clostridium]|uniref:Uncharacterized protein n=2 Tax=Clostridium TaxID=1485 RepID=A0A846J6T8_CLOBO|nr:MULTISPECIES: hypothetical protein [Clostridium]EKX80610.1 hypothetical protein CFSAN001628_005524 [Clostridium botulinum CFSAN001628]ACA57390.1 hypothetical protein CLK_A0255 [Clostridium botulinum A3 str. Loch Maree]APF25212.1 hypothetical protein NPD7_3934 [Clostridium sporogenes]APH14805.1 hypothetical protein NPD5_4031 [Clostridium sporogenes]MBD5563701.1 hypothetical protein [Clostridium botulinum]
MITKGLKDKGLICKGKGFNCPNCKDKNECIDYVECEARDGQQACYQCYGECKEIYQVKVIDEKGKMTFEKVCSEECASEVIQELYYLHKQRGDDVKNQVIQKLKSRS